MKTPVLLEQILHPVGPNSKVVASLQMVSFGQSIIPGHGEGSVVADLQRVLSLSLYDGHLD